MTSKKVAFTAFEVEGKWFLPENSDYKIEGTLKYTPYELPILELRDDIINTIKEESSAEYFNRIFSSSKVPIILGQLYNGETIGEKITLYKCTISAKGFSTGLQKVNCYPAYILRGFHFYKEEDISFNNMSFHFKYLETWLSINNINLRYIPDKNKTRYEEIQVNYQPLPFTPLCNIDGITLGIKDRPIYSTNLYIASMFNAHIGAVPVSEDKLFELNSPDFKQLDKYVELIFKVQDFLVFAIGQATTLTEISTILKIKVKKPQPVYDIEQLSEGYTETNVVFKNEYFSFMETSGIEIVEKEEEEEVTVKIYFKLFNSETSKEFQYDNVFFYFSQIKNNFNNVFTKWYLNQEKLETVFSLYLGLFYIPTRYLRERFLSLAQSIEAFHRIIYGGKYMEKEDYINGIYQDFVEIINSKTEKYNLQSDFKDSIKITLSHLYQFSLRKRLKELIREHEPYLPEIFQGKQQRNLLSEKITNIRNNFTHLDEDSNVEITSKELNEISNILEALLIGCIMKFLEIDTATIKQSIERILKLK